MVRVTKPAAHSTSFRTPLELEFTEDVDRDTESLIRGLLEDWDRDLFGVGPVRLRPLLGGANNRNFIVECDAGKYALRVANALAERLAVDRASALQAQRDAAVASVAPKVLAWRLPAGHQLSEFREGTVLSPENLHDDTVLRGVGQCLAQLHAAPTTARSFSPFEDIRLWTETAVRDDIELSPTHRELLSGAEQVRLLVESLSLPEVFCHNDTVPQNFIQNSNDMTIVDWDYAGRGLACFELGSFACTADLDPEETSHLLSAYGIAPTAPVVARMGLMAFVAAVREIAWVIMAAPVLAGTTGVTTDWYENYLAVNSVRAAELRARWCTPEGFSAAEQRDPSSRI